MMLKQPTLTFHGLTVGKDSLVGERLGLRFGRIFMEELECFFLEGKGMGRGVSFETPIVYQFPGELPTELLSVIIPVKYVILKSKLS